MALKDDMLNFRARHNMSQEEAAKRAQITRQTWGNVEAGIQTPSKITCAKIENLFRQEDANENVN